MQLGFGTGILTAIPLLDAAGAAVANGTPVQFGTMQEITGDLSFEEKLLYGASQFPIAVGRGKGKFSFKAKLAEVKGVILSDLFFGVAATSSSKLAVNDFVGNVPGSVAYTITPAPPGTGVFAGDLGVRDGETGLAFKKVGSAPATGEYMVSNLGVYTFAAAQANKKVFISFEYTEANKGKLITLTNQLMGQAPSFRVQLQSSYQGKHFSLGLLNCVSNKFSLPFKSDDFFIPDFEFSAFADGAGNIGYMSLAE